MMEEKWKVIDSCLSATGALRPIHSPLKIDQTSWIDCHVEEEALSLREGPLKRRRRNGHYLISLSH